MKPLAYYFHVLQGFTHRPWYLPFGAFLAGLDLFILVIPTDGILITAVLLNPRSWVRAFLLFSVGSSLGAWGLCEAVQLCPPWLTDQLLQGIFHSEMWSQTETFVAQYGYWAIALSAGSFLPLPPAIALAALAHMPSGEVFVAVLLGRLFKFSILCWIASHAPKYLMKIPIIRKEIELLHRPELTSKVSPDTQTEDASLP